MLLVLPDRPEFAFAWFGAAKIGAVIAMVNPLLPADDYLHYFDYTRAKVAIVDAEHARPLEPLRARSPTCGTWSWSGRPGPAPLVRGALRARRPTGSRTRTRTATTPRSGCSPAARPGKPKAAVHLQQDLPWNTERYAKQVLGIREDDVTLSVPKLFFGYATGTNLMFPFAVGAATALFERAQRARARCSTSSSATARRSSPRCRP